MNVDLVRIHNFDRYLKRYLYQHPNGKLTKTKGEDWETTPSDWEKGIPNIGDVKKFWFGRNVLVYTFDGVPYIKVGRNLERIAEIGVVKQYVYGPFCFYSVKCGRIRTFAIGTQWLDFISRYIDPTYDEIDSMAADFAGYVNAVFKRASG